MTNDTIVSGLKKQLVKYPDVKNGDIGLVARKKTTALPCIYYNVQYHISNNQDCIYDSLITSYSDDVEKYSSGETQTKIMQHILEMGWQKGGQTVTFERFDGSHYSSREIGEAFRTIQKAMLLELVYPTISNRLPLEAQLSCHPKMIWLDTGLMNYKSGKSKTSV